MGSQDKAEVVPLFGEPEEAPQKADSTESSAAVIEWTELSTSQPGAYRRMLEILFAPRDDEAA